MAHDTEGPFDARRILGPAADWIALIGATAILAMAVAVVVDVLMRWVFNSPILGADDFASFNLAVIVASFFPICLVGGHFVTIRFVGKALGQRRALWLEVFGGMATLFVFVLLAWQVFRFTLYDVTLTGLATHVLEFPQAPWWWVVTAIIVLCVPIQLVVVAESVVGAVLGVARPADGETKTDAGV
jgi:TRAP-type C4-dicarboxylate transport system permease small subunit